MYLMKKSQTSNKVFAIQKLSDNGLDELIKGLKADNEHLEFVYTAKNLSGMCAKEDIERNSRYHLYCELLLEIAKNEQKTRKSKTKNELK